MANNYRAKMAAVLMLAGASLIGTALTGAAKAQNSSSPVPVEVETETFGQDSFALGTLSASKGALPRDLWQGASASDVAYLLDNLPTRLDHPAQTESYKRLLLSPGSSPQGADNVLTGKKLMVLARIGFYEQAASLAGLAGNIEGEPELAEAIAYAAMMDGDMTGACQRGETLLRGRDRPFWLKLRLLCYGATGENAAADLTFGLLQEASDLSDTDIKLFNAIATGQKPRKSVAPLDGFHYAAIRQLELPLKGDMLDKAEGAVFTALAREAAAPPEVRAASAMRMVAHGVISIDELASIFASMEFETEQLADALTMQKRNRDNLLVDALVFQASKLAMDGGNFDKESLIGAALRNASDPYRFRALAGLYYRDVQQFSVVQNYAPWAGEFALVGIAMEDRDLVERWVGALLFDQSAEQPQEAALSLLALTAMWQRSAADYISSVYGLPTVSTPSALASFPAPRGSSASLARLVDIAINAAEARSKGVEGLIAMTGMGLGGSGELAAIRDTIVGRALQKSGLDALNQQIAFTQVFGETHHFIAKRKRMTGGLPDDGGPDNGDKVEHANAAIDMVIPRLKPQRRG